MFNTGPELPENDMSVMRTNSYPTAAEVLCGVRTAGGCMATQIAMAAAKSTIACMMLLLQSHVSLAAGVSPLYCMHGAFLIIVSDTDHQFRNRCQLLTCCLPFRGQSIGALSMGSRFQKPLSSKWWSRNACSLHVTVHLRALQQPCI